MTTLQFKWSVAMLGLMGLGCAVQTDDGPDIGTRAAAVDVACTLQECGPAPLAPNILCPDGVTVAGPSECMTLADGTCGYEFIECPDAGFCGGIAGIPCPGGETCVDNPNDLCDPQDGGADCPGMCVPTFCGGIAGIPCPGDEICVDDPSDGCDPQNGGADCGGICVPDSFCGGIAGIPCPDGEMCIDDPTDLCDPLNGGADCGGICVPDPGGCEPELCEIACPFGFALDENGCEFCECAPEPCSKNKDCAKSGFCEFEPGTCGADGGACQPRPMACTAQFDPVCGCNGKTYSNVCVAAAARKSVDHVGACN